MGDLVLTEGEVNDVISELHAGGIEQSALHNHVLGESPRVMYLHFSGHGDAGALARTLRSALERTTPPLQPPSGIAAAPELPAAEMDRILGYSGSQMAACCSTASRAPSGSSSTGWKFRLPQAWRQPSTFSRPATAARQSPETL
jgi:hypothetical protein